MLDADAELLDALGPYVPRFRFLLDDLSTQTDADLRARTQMTAGGRVAILSLKHAGLYTNLSALGSDPSAAPYSAAAPLPRSGGTPWFRFTATAAEVCIQSRKDPARLERWHERAILAASVAEVIDEPS